MWRMVRWCKERENGRNLLIVDFFSGSLWYLRYTSNIIIDFQEFFVHCTKGVLRHIHWVNRSFTRATKGSLGRELLLHSSQKLHRQTKSPQTPILLHLLIWVVVLKIFFFISNLGEDSHVDEHIFQMGWNHQLVIHFSMAFLSSVACHMLAESFVPWGVLDWVVKPSGFYGLGKGPLKKNKRLVGRLVVFWTYFGSFIPILHRYADCF